MSTTQAPGFAVLLQDFFCQHLMSQRNVSPQTIAAYRDTFRLLFRYLEDRKGKRTADLALSDLDATCVLAFLEYLEKDRKNAVRTRNARLAAVRAFLKYAAVRDPVALPSIQRVLAIPVKRFDKPLMEFLSRQEMQAIIDAPDARTFSGRRDRVLFTLMYNTGARVSEVAALRVGDIALGETAHARLRGKGRKDRSVPLWKTTAQMARQWMNGIDRDPEATLLPNASGQPLSRSGIEHRLRRAVKTATLRHPELKGRKISPHTLRHTTAMHLLQSGVDITVIALWLGHESPATTHMYIEADLALKTQALNKLEEPPRKRLQYKASDKLLRFLDGL